jgi:hypothetical protein
VHAIEQSVSHLVIRRSVHDVANEKALCTEMSEQGNEGSEHCMGSEHTRSGQRRPPAIEMSGWHSSGHDTKRREGRHVIKNMQVGRDMLTRSPEHSSALPAAERHKRTLLPVKLSPFASVLSASTVCKTKANGNGNSRRNSGQEGGPPVRCRSTGQKVQKCVLTSQMSSVGLRTAKAASANEVTEISVGETKRAFAPSLYAVCSAGCEQTKTTRWMKRCWQNRLEI